MRIYHSSSFVQSLLISARIKLLLLGYLGFVKALVCEIRTECVYGLEPSVSKEPNRFPNVVFTSHIGNT